MLAAIHFLDVLHQCPECAGVGIARGIAQGAEQFHALAVLQLDPRVALVVLLDPVGDVAGQPVFPTAEPQEHQLQAVLAGFLDETIRQREFILALRGLHLRPVNGGQHAVEIARHQFGPDRLHVLQAGSGVVSQFSGERQERLAIHDQLRGGALFPQVRDLTGGLCIALERDQRRARERQLKRNSHFHFSVTSIVFSSRTSALDAPSWMLILPGSTTKLWRAASQ